MIHIHHNKEGLDTCPVCGSEIIEEDWDGVWQGAYDTQVGFLDCKSCHFGISQIFSTEHLPDSEFSSKLYSLWNSIRIVED